jgi:hypothetical protein
MPVKLRASAALGVVFLAACGGGHKVPDNGELASQLRQKLGNGSATLVCFTHKGYLGGVFHHAYDRGCGPRQGVSSIYIDLDEQTGTWCVITPRYAKLPLCPGFG